MVSPSRLGWRTTPALPLSFGVDLLDCDDLATFREIADIALSNCDAESAARVEYPFLIAKAFSAKEAAIKALSAELGRVAEFEEISVLTNGDTWRLAHPDFDAELSCRSLKVGHLLATVVAMRASNGLARTFGGGI